MLVVFAVAGAVFQVCTLRSLRRGGGDGDRGGDRRWSGGAGGGRRRRCGTGDGPELGAAAAIACGRRPACILALCGRPPARRPAAGGLGRRGAVGRGGLPPSPWSPPRPARSAPPCTALHGVGLGLAVTSAGAGGGGAHRASDDLGVLAAMPARDLVILGYTGLVATGGAYLAFALGMRLSRSPTVGMAPTLIEPGVAAVLAALDAARAAKPARGGRLRADAGRDDHAGASSEWRGFMRGGAPAIREEIVMETEAAVRIGENWVRNPHRILADIEHEFDATAHEYEAMSELWDDPGARPMELPSSSTTSRPRQRVRRGRMRDRAGGGSGWPRTASAISPAATSRSGCSSGPRRKGSTAAASSAPTSARCPSPRRASTRWCALPS